MFRRRLAAADSPFRRLGAHVATSLKSAGDPTGSSRHPLRRITDSTLPRIGGYDATLRRLGAVARRPSTPRPVDLLVGIPRTTRWMSTLPGGGPASSVPAGGAPTLPRVATRSSTPRPVDLVVGIPRTTRWMSTLPGGGPASSVPAGAASKTGPASAAPAGGAQKTGPASSAGGADEHAQKTGPASSAGGADEHGSGAEEKGPKAKEKFDWENFDWNLFMQSLNFADVIRKVLKLLGFIGLCLSACGGAAYTAVHYLLKSEIKEQVGVERGNRVEFEKKATVAHQEFVFRTNTRYDHLQAQFFELWEKNLALERLCNQLQKQLDGQAKGGKPDGNH